MAIDIANPGASDTALRTALGALRPLPFFGTYGAWSRPSFTGWINQSSGITNATITDNSGGFPLIITGAADNVTDYVTTARIKSAPSAPWTIITAQAAWGGGAAYTYPLFARNSSNGKGAGFQWVVNAKDGLMAVNVVSWANFNVGTTPVAVDNAQHDPPFSDYFLWFKMAFSGSAFTFSIGPDGILWEDQVVTDASGFPATVDQVGFGIERATNAHSSGARGNQSAILWHWVES